MKTIFTTALTLCTFLMANAQIQLSTDDVYSLGTYQMAYDTSGAFNEGTPGANKTWDFSTLKQHDKSTIRVVPYTDNGLGIDANMVELEGNDTLSYIKKTSTEVTVYYQTGPSSGDFESTKLFNFPAKYNDRMIDSVSSVTYFTGDDFGMPLIDSVRMTSKIKFDNTVDAWGSLKLPMGTFNSLRMKMNIYFDVQVAAKTGKLPYVEMPAFGQVDTSYNYTWFTNGKGRYIASYYPEDGEMEFMVSSGLSSKSVVSTKTGVVASNPFNNQMVINNSGNDGILLTIFDMNGKQIESKKVAGKSQATLETSAYNSGIYTIQYLNLTNHSVSFQKVIK